MIEEKYKALRDIVYKKVLEALNKQKDKSINKTFLPKDMENYYKYEVVLNTKSYSFNKEANAFLYDYTKNGIKSKASHSTIVFYHPEHLTKEEVLKIFEGTKDIINIKGCKEEEHIKSIKNYSELTYEMLDKFIEDIAINNKNYITINQHCIEQGHVNRTVLDLNLCKNSECINCRKFEKSFQSAMEKEHKKITFTTPTLEEINLKYYTPSIEEFHVGFEYQIEDLGDDGLSRIWRDQVFDGEETRTYFIEELRKKEMRVKYLDKEDIESLGWKPTEIEDNYVAGHKGGYKLNHLCINYLIIQGTDSMCWFKGIIKNKSELKKLMKQLNI